MTQIDRVKSLFNGVLELPEGVDASLWLRQNCGQDLALLHEVRSLLEARTEMRRRVMDRPAPDDQAIPTARFGAYRAVERVGRGGMSTVYLARRADGNFDQTVALKIMAGYLAGGEFQRRFETERRLLASLNHNHITRLLDGGLSSAGDPYLITEFVKGQTIDDYCDHRKLPLEARLRIFLQVCDAVEYAHRNLIVHRDLKPGNILVNQEGMAKLLDFGTASLMESETEATLTRARMLTPRYASPEQLRGERVNTATDIFSLGVVLYELLTGAWPFGNPGSVLSELSRATGDVGAKMPATAVSEESAARRSLTRQQLSRVLRGDIAPIVLKALENDPARRYESARQFAADIDNFLAGRPVLARQQTTLYRAGKFVRRRWLAVTAVVVFTLGLATAAIVARRQAQVARAEALKSEKISSFLSNMLSSGTKWGRGFTVAQMLDAAEPELAKSWKDDPLTEAALRTNLGASYTTLQQPERATFELEKALAIFQARGDPQGAARVLWILGQNAHVQGRFQMSAHFYQQALENLSRPGLDAPPLWTFRVKRDLGIILSYASPRYYPRARVLLEEATALGHRDTTIPPADLCNAQAHLGLVLAEEGKLEAAEAALQEALSLGRQDTRDGELVSVLQARIWMSAQQQDFAAAREFARRQYGQFVRDAGPDSVWSACSSLTWARFRAETGETNQALAQLRAAMPLVRKYMPRGNAFLWSPLAAASHVLLKAGRFAESERYARESLEVVEEAHLDEVDPWRAESLALIGAALAANGRGRDALFLLQRASAINAQLQTMVSEPRRRAPASR